MHQIGGGETVHFRKVVQTATLLASRRTRKKDSAPFRGCVFYKTFPETEEIVLDAPFYNIELRDQRRAIL